MTHPQKTFSCFEKAVTSDLSSSFENVIGADHSLSVGLVYGPLVDNFPHHLTHLLTIDTDSDSVSDLLDTLRGHLWTVC